MSNALGIAAVSAVLKDLLQNALIDHDVPSAVGPVTVSTMSPALVRQTTNGADPSQLNLFLYQVLPNSGWRNVGLPSRDDRGERMTNPPLALDLRYLLTAYGASDFVSEILMGYAAQVLHETPVLTRQAIRTALGPPSPVSGATLPPPLNTLTAADLADQVEQIKITPLYLDTEEMSKLWSTFDTAYRTSTAYHVSVVLIQSRRSTKSPLPVRDYLVYPVLLEQARIVSLASQGVADGPVLRGQPILPGHRLVVEGERLSGEITVVRVGDRELTPVDESETRLIVTLPTDLRAGIQGAQVIHRFPLGEPPLPHRGFESNVAAFVLRPVINKLPGPPERYDITISTSAGPGGRREGTVTVNFSNPVGREQRVLLLLNRLGVPFGQPVPSYGFEFDRWPTAPGDEQRTSIVFRISGVEAGDYLLRVQVDGAETVLEADAGGVYTQPRVTI